jgi:hypothetical protein
LFRKSGVPNGVELSPLTFLTLQHPNNERYLANYAPCSTSLDDHLNTRTAVIVFAVQKNMRKAEGDEQWITRKKREGVESFVREK